MTFSCYVYWYYVQYLKSHHVLYIHVRHWVVFILKDIFSIVHIWTCRSLSIIVWWLKLCRPFSHVYQGSNNRYIRKLQFITHRQLKLLGSLVLHLELQLVLALYSSRPWHLVTVARNQLRSRVEGLFRYSLQSWWPNLLYIHQKCISIHLINCIHITSSTLGFLSIISDWIPKIYHILGFLSTMPPSCFVHSILPPSHFIG